MCGISGIINPPSQHYGVADLKAMTDVISYRGPDDEGYVLFDDAGNCVAAGGNDTPADVYNTDIPYKPTGILTALQQKDFKVAFGHRRLAILDLSAYGHLPMSYSNNRYWISFNGEIYNFIELKHELIAAGHSFISHTDTEVILAAYAQWGTDCLKRFHGMWSFAVYDKETKEIFLARDRFGIKPLYYWNAPNNAFCFASEIKQFTTLPGWQAILNRQRAFDYLMYNMTDHTEETMFKQVFHVPAGHYFKSTVNSICKKSNGSVELVKWYQTRYKGNSETLSAAADQFKVHFQQSVKEHLVADVPVGSALSGGLDSSAIVCEINELLKKEGQKGKQKTFSYCSADETYNEKKWVEEVVKVTNVEAHYVYENTADVFEKAEELIWYNDEPNQSQSELATYQVYKAARQNNIKVLINGQGADEYLSGYDAFKMFRWVKLLKGFKFKQLNDEILNHPKKAKEGKLKNYIHLFYYLVPDVVRRYFSRRTSTYQNLKAIISLDQLKAAEKHPYDEIVYNSASIFNIAHRQLLHYPLPKYLRYEDRMSMCNSVEARVPFLDHRLVDFTTQLPADYLDGKQESKKILLEGLKDILPAPILTRKDKIGFVTSEEQWVRKQFTPEFREMLKQSISHSKGIIQPQALDYFDNIVSGNTPFDYTYWRLIAFGLWMKRFNVILD
ncbi:MAG: asparagine synthase (glutamine-hydrolyzing) [Chitinophagaceae bacterium]|nr:asparagine synthase (glutamine-hydrolyzing) [Chitinophagaceae bacterium]